MAGETSVAQIVYTGGAGVQTGSRLFAGITFWISLKCPMRSRFKDIVEVSCSCAPCDSLLMMMQSNGGTVTTNETQASLKIADHKKKEAIVGA